MKILMLGATGFAGRNFNNLFKNKGIDCYTSSLNNGTDLCDYESTLKLFNKIRPDVIVNLAAKVGSLNYVTQYAAEVFDVNMRMILNIFKAREKTDSNIILINPIANCAFPGNLENYTEEKFWDGKVHQSVYAYGNTRRMIEVISECHRMQYGVKTINFYVPNMYGPFDSTDPNKAHALNALVSKFVKAKNENKKSVEIWGSGIAIREWLYVEDFARIIVEVLSGGYHYEFSSSVNIAQNFGLSISDLAQLIIEIVDYKGSIIWNRNYPDGALKKVMSDNLFRKAFPSFEFTDFKRGIKSTVGYYESVYPY